VNVREIIVLVPTLLGLKGNLDMSLASRLSTQVNLGEVHNKETIIQAMMGNVTLKLVNFFLFDTLAHKKSCVL
jgi:solute carrier family 41